MVQVRAARLTGQPLFLQHFGRERDGDTVPEGCPGTVWQAGLEFLPATNEEADPI